MSGWEDNAVAILLAVLALAGTAFTAWRTAKSSDTAARVSADVQDRANAVDGMDRLVARLETRLERVEEEARVKGTQLHAMEERLDALESELHDTRQELATTRATLRDSRSLFIALVAYCRQLRRDIAALGSTPRPVPELLTVHLAEPFQE